MSPRLVERRVEVPPYALWEVRAGERGSPVVLVHGLSGSSRWWKRNISALAQHHRVAAVDLVGFGRTRRFRTPTPLPPSFDSLIALLARWIETSFGVSVHLVGHSMGGQIAIHLASRHPDLVRSLVLVDSTGIPFELNPKAHLRNLLYPQRGWFSFSPLLIRDFLRAGPTSVGIAFSRLLSNDAREEMRQIGVPTLILWGDRDPIVPISYAQQIRETIPGSRLALLEDAGHVSMWDNPEAFNREVLRFLEDVDSAMALPASPRLRVPASFSWGVSGCVGGICYRQSGPRTRLVLIHGLSIGTSYLSALARELHRRGWSAIAPDLPGCGHSNDLPESPNDYGSVLLRWAERLELPPMVWIGHSTGCQLVDALARLAPDRCAGVIHLSPIWNRFRHPWWTLGLRFFRDVWRESVTLVGYGLRAYWNSGLARILRQVRFYVGDSPREPQIDDKTLLIVGEADPLTDWSLLRTLAPDRIRTVPGPHGIVFASPSAVADEIAHWLTRA